MVFIGSILHELSWDVKNTLRNPSTAKGIMLASYIAQVVYAIVATRNEAIDHAVIIIISLIMLVATIVSSVEGIFVGLLSLMFTGNLAVSGWGKFGIAAAIAAVIIIIWRTSPKIYWVLGVFLSLFYACMEVYALLGAEPLQHPLWCVAVFMISFGTFLMMRKESRHASGRR